MSFFTYMLRCADQSYYIGHTENLDHRIAQHHAGEYPGYTRHRRPLTLVWAQEFATREEALAAERQIKGWSRPKKEALIHSDWKAIQQHERRAVPSFLAPHGGWAGRSPALGALI